jgi:hypothetical protein
LEDVKDKFINSYYLVTDMEQNSNRLVSKGERVNLTFNSKQIELIDSLVGEMGDNRSDVVKTIFLNYLSEKEITTAIIKKKLKLK